MKHQRILISLGLAVAILLPSASALAATHNYTGSITWDQTTCAGYINGLNQSNPSTVTIAAGDTIQITLINNASIPMNFSAQNAGSIVGSGTLAPSESTSSITFSNIQSTANLVASPDPFSNSCGYKVDSGLLSYQAAQPAPAASSSTAPTSASSSSSAKPTTPSSTSTTTATPTSTNPAVTSSILNGDLPADGSPAIQTNPRNFLIRLGGIVLAVVLGLLLLWKKKVWPFRRGKKAGRPRRRR